MAFNDIISRQITGIRPFNELPIDAEVWREAHNQHNMHRQLHAAAVHRPGIVAGLEVVASRQSPNTVVVAPGVGIDSNGQMVVLSEPVRLTIEEARQTFIVLSFLRAVDRNSAVTVGGGEQYYREVEGRDLKQTKELPSTPYLELARVFRSSAEAPITDAKLAFSPVSDEINALYRRVAFPSCFADALVGELSYVPKKAQSPWNPNRQGLWKLLSIGNGNGFHLGFSGPFSLRQESAPDTHPVMLYVAGSETFQPLADGEVEGLTRYLEHGGLLVAEVKANGEGFMTGIQALLMQLGAKLKPVEKNHALLNAHSVFGVPPTGARQDGMLLADTEAGIIFSTWDYGGAWNGDTLQTDPRESREVIRQSHEFGLNLIAYAAARKRRIELSRLS